MRTLLLTLICALATVSTAAPLEFSSLEEEQRFRNLTEDLRCLVCQNQSLADSGAGLADDLKAEVLRLIREGKSDEAIVNYLVERYGNFVRYNPPFEGYIVLLWVVPPALLLLALIVAVKIMKNRTQLPDEEDKE